MVLWQPYALEPATITTRCWEFVSLSNQTGPSPAGMSGQTGSCLHCWKKKSQKGRLVQGLMQQLVLLLVQQLQALARESQQQRGPWCRLKMPLGLPRRAQL